MSNRSLDAVMESASQALVCMDYLHCEELCLNALAIARRIGDWPSYGRVLMPLQEARRQRRMIAAEGVIRLGSASLNGEPPAWLEQMGSGCLVLTRPHTVDHAIRLVQLACKQRQYVEAIFADGDVTDKFWLLRSFTGSAVNCTVAAPADDCRDRWLTSDATEPASTQHHGRPADGCASDEPDPHSLASDWFFNSCEALGDAALVHVTAALGSVERITQLKQCLDAVTDHEILHQRLGDAARAVRT